MSTEKNLAIVALVILALSEFAYRPSGDEWKYSIQ